MPLIKIDPRIRSLIYFLAAVAGPILVAAGKVTEAQWAEIIGYMTTLFGAAVAVDNRPSNAAMDEFADQVIADFISSHVSWSRDPESAVPQVEPPAGVTAYEGD